MGQEQGKGALPDGQAELDRIEAEAAAMSPPPAGSGIAEPADAGRQGKKPFEQPPGAFEATHEMIVKIIKNRLGVYIGGDEAGAVWDSPLFKDAIIPVMQKYNISVFNLPCELVLGGVILMLAKQSADILRLASKKHAEEKPAEAAPAAA